MSQAPHTVVDRLPLTYASQFLLTLSEDSLWIEASAGRAAGKGDGGNASALPIHSRWAVPWSAARRLATVLNAAIARHDEQAAGVPPSLPTPPATMPTASETAQLPRLEV